MRLFSTSSFSRWTPWAVSGAARHCLLRSGWGEARPALIAQGSRGGASYPGSQAQRERVSVVRNWIHERGKHEGKPYPCNIIPVNRVSLGYLVLILPRHLTFRDGTVDIFIEFSPPGTRHPRCFARRATPEDPANRLALRIRGETLQEGPFTDYVHTTGECLMHKANALADFLLDTASREEIMKRPRRAWETVGRGPRKKTARKE